MAGISSDIIRGYNDTIILYLLLDKPSYGYEISKQIKALSDEKYIMKETTLYSAFTRMEKNGYIIRTTSERDARLKKITLTDKALKIHTHSMAQIKSIEEQMRSGISDRDLDIFFDVLDKIKVNLTNDD